MIGQVFTVLTEFQFEIGSAVLQTNTLTGAVDKLSASAENAMGTLEYAAASIIGSIGGAGGGILGILYSFISSADKFNSSQISLANTLQAPGEAFADAMERSEQTMERIGSIAKQFSLSGDDLLNLTKFVGPMLKTHGLAGANYEAAIQLGRRFLKAAPILGVDPGLAMGQMQSAVGGRASLGDTLFQRLTAETSSMSGMTSKQFNAKDAKERLHLLNTALGEFANNTDAVHAQTKTLTGQMMLLRTQLTGTFSIFRELGQVIIQPILQVLERLNGFIELFGKQLVGHLSHAMKPFLKDIDTMYTSLRQISSLKKDVTTTSNLLGNIGKFVGLNALLVFFGIKIPFISAALAGLSKGFMSLIGPIGATAAATTGVIGTLFALASSMANILLLAGLVVAFMQLFTKAFGYGLIKGAESIKKWSVYMSEIMSNTAGIFGVLYEAWDVLARLLGEALDPTKFLGFINILQIGVILLDSFNAVLGGMLIYISGISLYYMEFMRQIKEFMSGDFGAFDRNKMNEAFDFGMQEVADKIFGKVKDPDGGGVANQIVNMDVKMENHFKEMMEPDRVAFTIKDQLLKASQNRTTGSKAAFKPAGAF